MRSGIKEMKNSKKGKAPASHFFKFLYLPTFGTFAKSHEPTHNQNFAKEPNFPTHKTTIRILTTL